MAICGKCLTIEKKNSVDQNLRVNFFFDTITKIMTQMIIKLLFVIVKNENLCMLMRNVFIVAICF